MRYDVMSEYLTTGLSIIHNQCTAQQSPFIKIVVSRINSDSVAIQSSHSYREVISVLPSRLDILTHVIRKCHMPGH